MNYFINLTFLIFIIKRKEMENRTNRNCYAHQKERALKRKLMLVFEKGGKCEICGYDKNISALEFHHTDPSQKSFPLDSRHLSNSTIEKLKSEAEKCMLLCSNCHREIHHQSFNKDEIKETIKKIDDEIKTLLEEYEADRVKRNICPVCGKSFKRVTGKTFCSKECMLKSRNYPSYEEIQKKYDELHSWEKVGNFFNISRRVIQGIRKRHENS